MDAASQRSHAPKRGRITLALLVALLAVGATVVLLLSREANQTDQVQTQEEITPGQERQAAQRACPAGLPELVADPLSSARGRSLFGNQTPELVPFVELNNATVLSFIRGPSGNSGQLSGFVGARNARVWFFTFDASDPAARPVLSPEPIIDLSARTATDGERGLVGMAVGPQNKWLYLHRSLPNGDGVLTAHSIGAVVGLEPTIGAMLTNENVNSAADKPVFPKAGEAVELMVVEQPAANHNGGDITFGPQGYLYAAFGDGGGSGDQYRNGQDLSTPLGAILRLQVDPTKPPGERAVAAPGNPYLDGNDGRGGSADPRIWVSGARNPYRMTYDPVYDRLWVSDVGQRCIEEFDALRLDEGGADLGWNVFEGSNPFLGEPTRTHRLPDFEYAHGRGLCSVSGGQTYDGQAFPGLRGWFVWADLCGGRLMAFDPGVLSSGPPSVSNGGANELRVVDLEVTAEVVIGVAIDPLGELYVIDLANGIYRLNPASG